MYERDQLWKRLGLPPARRLAELERHAELVGQRDDLTVELSALYNQTGRHAKALALLSGRKFQPWEGGEGQVLGQYVRTRLALGRQAMRAGSAEVAWYHFKDALTAPENLGEAKHLLANQSDVWFWLGSACEAMGDNKAARNWWIKAAEFKGDFQQMSARSFSEQTYYSALALEKLGRKSTSRALLHALLKHSLKLSGSPAHVDYFATSLLRLLIY